MKKLVYDHGINDSDYPVYRKVKGKIVWRCPYYRKWVGMLMRCYSVKFHAKQPTYIDCTVSEEWKTFSVFREWMEKQVWENKHLDKDIIQKGNKHYCKELCCFVSPQVNNLLNDSAAIRGDLPQGVSYYPRDGSFRAQIKFRGKHLSLGLWDTPEACYRSYALAKARILRVHALEESNREVRKGLLRHSDFWSMEASAQLSW